jgi:polysaccharide export outer membrane protein
MADDVGEDRRVSPAARILGFGLELSLLSACAALPYGGPSTKAISGAKGEAVAGNVVQLVDVTEAASRKVAQFSTSPSFLEEFGEVALLGAVVGNGDVLDISIWEAPPAALFGTLSSGFSLAASQGGIATARSSSLPEQMVPEDGVIRVPFAGSITAAGRSTSQIAADIRARLLGKANDPQVLVRVVRNATSNVTVVGEVANSMRVPLTAKGERLLDALATAGGVRQPVGKMTIQMTRGSKVGAMPLEAVIKDPRQNVRLRADDVVTLLFQPYSFTVLGAARSNQEIPFEATGLTLSQALGRMGGLDDQRAHPKGVFIFRFEDPALFAAQGSAAPASANGKIPVIYRVDMRDPKTLFVAQAFPIRDKDVVYVSNAPLADFAKFLQAVSQIVYPIATIQNTNIF